MDDNSYEAFVESLGLDGDSMEAALKSAPEPLVEEGAPYEVRPSEIHGKGVFVTKDVDGYIGILKKDEWYELGRYANHSATPNAKVNILNDKLVVYGKVKAGEEITLDYSLVKEMVELQESILVVDDFCDQIEMVIASAKAAGFSTWRPNKGEVGTSVYDGMGFWGHHALMLRNIIPAVDDVIIPNAMFFRVTNEGMEKAYIHSDRESGNWTCVAYLSEHDKPYGTAFYRHKPTGLIEMPSFQEMKEMGIFEELKEDMVSRDPEKWEQIGYVEGKYNRALIFYAPLFHSRYPLEGIGTNEEEGRLVWVSHFFKLDGYGRLY